MRVRESGMPPEETWEGFFSPAVVLGRLGLSGSMTDAADVGCGYGTFTLPAAGIIRGTLHAFDIEADMIETARSRATARGITNIAFHERDFMAQGTGLPDDSVDYVMVFNILHTEHPADLLREAWRILRPDGKAGILHWRYDATTPRGPSMEIRPRPQQCRQWVVNAGFHIGTPHVDLPPYHYGIVASKILGQPSPDR